MFRQNGLIATNHHVASIERLSSKERNLLKAGFYAKMQLEELKIPDASASFLASYENVTGRVHNAAMAAVSDSDASGEHSAKIAAANIGFIETNATRAFGS